MTNICKVGYSWIIDRPWDQSCPKIIKLYSCVELEVEGGYTSFFRKTRMWLELGLKLKIQYRGVISSKLNIGVSSNLLGKLKNRKIMWLLWTLPGQTLLTNAAVLSVHRFASARWCILWHRPLINNFRFTPCTQPVIPVRVQEAGLPVRCQVQLTRVKLLHALSIARIYSNF